MAPVPTLPVWHWRRGLPQDRDSRKQRLLQAKQPRTKGQIRVLGGTVCRGNTETLMFCKDKFKVSPFSFFESRGFPPAPPRIPIDNSGYQTHRPRRSREPIGAGRSPVAHATSRSGHRAGRAVSKREVRQAAMPVGNWRQQAAP